MFLHLLASLTGKILSRALPWAVSEYKPHGDKDRPHGKCPGAASNTSPPRTQLGTGCRDSDGSCDLGATTAKHEDSQANSVSCHWRTRMDAQRKNVRRNRASKSPGHGPPQTGALGLVAGA